jgi:hypothetical protein
MHIVSLCITPLVHRLLLLHDELPASVELIYDSAALHYSKLLHSLIIEGA